MMLHTVVRMAEESRHEPRPYLIRRDCWLDELFYSLGNTEFYAERFGSDGIPRPPSFCIADLLATDWQAVLPADAHPGWVAPTPSSSKEGDR